VEVRLRDNPQRDDKQGGEERKILDDGQRGSYAQDGLSTTLARSRLVGQFHHIGNDKRPCVHEWASSKIIGRTGSYPERELWEPRDGFWEMTLL
jgi:hypothetical protein